MLLFVRMSSALPSHPSAASRSRLLVWCLRIDFSVAFILVTSPAVSEMLP